MQAFSALDTSAKRARLQHRARCALQLDEKQYGRRIAYRAREVTFPAVARDGVLIGAEGDFARAHLDALAVHRLDEPAPGQRNDPLWLRVLVPRAHPARRQYGDHRGHLTAELVSQPLRSRRWADGGALELAHKAARLVADPIRIRPDVPVSQLRFFGACHCMTPGYVTLCGTGTARPSSALARRTAAWKAAGA